MKQVVVSWSTSIQSVLPISGQDREDSVQGDAHRSRLADTTARLSTSALYIPIVCCTVSHSSSSLHCAKAQCKSEI